MAYTEISKRASEKYRKEKQHRIPLDYKNEEYEHSWTHTYQGLTKEDKYRVIEEKIVFKKGENSFEIESSGITKKKPHQPNG